MTMKTLSGIGWPPPSASVNQYLTRSSWSWVDLIKSLLLYIISHWHNCFLKYVTALCTYSRYAKMILMTCCLLSYKNISIYTNTMNKKGSLLCHLSDMWPTFILIPGNAHSHPERPYSSIQAGTNVIWTHCTAFLPNCICSALMSLECLL